MPCARLRAACRPWPWATLLLATSLIVVAPLSGRRADDIQLSADWRSDAVRIDGNDEEWRGRTVPLAKQRFMLGLQNDGEALYLCLTTRDRVLTTQIARQGLMVWLDPGVERPKKHQFGVHFPIDPRLSLSRDAAARWPRDGANVSEWSQAAIGILGPGKGEPRRVPLDETGGLEARVGALGEVLVFELKVPLKSAAVGPYALAAEPGGAFRLEVETPEWRGPLPPSRGPIGIGVAASAPGGRGVVGYPSVDATYLKQTDVKAVVRLSAGR